MIYIENNCNEPEYNLAFEEFVLTRTDYKEPVLLLWQNRPAVIIGKYQNTPEEINYDFIKENNVKVVRRNTGGGAVYHDLGNLNYSFIIPDVELKVDFKTFTKPVVKALRSQGVDAVQTGRNDILVDGQKFSGNAQQFSKNKLLHHGTLMFDVQMENVAKALTVKAGKFKSKATKSVRSRVINLKPLLKVDSVEDFKMLLLEWFDREYGIKKAVMTEEQLEEIRQLSIEKYSSDSWNYGRSPKAAVTRGEFFDCGYIEFNFSIEKYKIKDVTVVGDFFAEGEISDVEEALKGVEYTEEAVLEVLRGLELGRYFGDVKAEELTRVIV